MVRNVDIFSKDDIKKVVMESMEKELEFVYGEMDKLRGRINDLEDVMKAILKYEKVEEKENGNGK